MALPSRLAILRQRATGLAKGSAASIIFAAAFTNVLRIISSATLTRLLDVSAFGVVGLVTTVAYVFVMVSDIGVQPFVIRHAAGDDRAFLDEIWTLRLIRSVALTLAMLALARPVAWLLGKPQFGPVIMLWSVSFLLDGLSSMSFATAVRERRLWRMAMLDVLAAVFQFVVSVGLVLVYRSYWALIAAMIVGSGIKAILSYALFPHSLRRLRLRRASARELWAFSRFIAPSSLMSIFILQADKLVLARLMPIAVFSLYALAATIATSGSGLASDYVRRVLFPIYAEAVRANSQSLSAVYYRARRWPTLLYMAAMGGIGGSASLIVAILYDRRYAGVALFLRILTISATFTLANTAAAEMLIALGRLRLILFATLTRLLWLVTGIALVYATSRNLVGFVAVFGTMEIGAAVFCWINLARVRILDVRQEALGVAAALAAALLGFVLAESVLALVQMLTHGGSLHDALRMLARRQP
ncbi:MAG: oligosaccharide flippase family protein [Sphingomonadales bacterium]|nr:oligosaccharide flippase family protein [Sphingomonadales bacterium]